MTSEDANPVFEEIVWPSRPKWNDDSRWDRHIELVRMLCRIGTVKAWLNDNDGYEHMPLSYEIDGVTVGFLPHWISYAVEGIHLDIPGSEEDILRAVALVNGLRELGYKWAKRG